MAEEVKEKLGESQKKDLEALQPPLAYSLLYLIKRMRVAELVIQGEVVTVGVTVVVAAVAVAGGTSLQQVDLEVVVGKSDRLALLLAINCCQVC